MYDDEAASPSILWEPGVALVDKKRLAVRRASVVVFALLDACGTFALLLQETDGGFPRSLSELHERWDEELTREEWFTPLVSSLAFQLLGVVGALLLWRWPLWAYCGGILVSLGALPPHTSASAPPPDNARSMTLNVGARLCLLFEAGRRESLVDTYTLVVDFVLLTCCVLLQIYIFQAASGLALLIGRLRLQRLFAPRDAPYRAASPERSGRRQGSGYRRDGRR